MNNFEARLNRFNLTEAQREKYLNINARTQTARAKAREGLKDLAEKVSFAGFVKGMKKLAFTDREIRCGNTALCLVPVGVSDDLLKVCNLSAASPAPQLHSIGVITVYEPAAADEEPHLTALDVLSQIPAEFADKVSAFCLHLEEKFALNGYNLLAQAYEYHVELFSR